MANPRPASARDIRTVRLPRTLAAHPPSGDMSDDRDPDAFNSGYRKNKVVYPRILRMDGDADARCSCNYVVPSTLKTVIHSFCPVSANRTFKLVSVGLNFVYWINKFLILLSFNMKFFLRAFCRFPK